MSGEPFLSGETHEADVEQANSRAAGVALQGLQPTFSIDYGLETIPHDWYGSMMNGLGDILGFFGSLPGCFCCPNPYNSVEQGFVGLISRFGKFYKAVDPGLVKVNPLTEEINYVDVKIQLAEIPGQVIMTKDNVTMQIDSVVYWHVMDPYQAVFAVSDVKSALIERTQTTLRHILGARVLQDCIENRETIGYEMQQIINPVASLWGIKIESILIKDLQFSKELQDTLSSAAQAKRVGESKVIAAQAEVDAAKLMREASEILNTPAAMQIRYLESMTTMARSPNTKVLFLPMPSAGGSSPLGEVTGPNISPLQATMYEHMSE